MTPPMTPREKVARVIAAELCRQDEDPEMTPEGVEFSPGDGLCWNYIDQGLFDFGQCADAILTALASGSGDHSGDLTDMVDHAELARLAEASKAAWPGGKWFRDYELQYGERGQIDGPDAAFIAAANPATVLALLAENAALRADVDRMSEVSEQCSRWIAAHDEQSERATEAERKLAEAESENTRWVLRFAEVREAAGIGVKPMLSEVPDELRKMRALIERAADLMRQCTDPDRFEGASTLNVYANMMAWLSDLNKEAERG